MAHPGARLGPARWIEDTSARFDGYLAFQRRPKPTLDWLFARTR
jgi:hypothetical protein